MKLRKFSYMESIANFFIDDLEGIDEYIPKHLSFDEMMKYMQIDKASPQIRDKTLGDILKIDSINSLMPMVDKYPSAEAGYKSLIGKTGDNYRFIKDVIEPNVNESASTNIPKIPEQLGENVLNSLQAHTHPTRIAGKVFAEPYLDVIDTFKEARKYPGFDTSLLDKFQAKADKLSSRDIDASSLPMYPSGQDYISNEIANDNAMEEVITKDGNKGVVYDYRVKPLKPNASKQYIENRQRRLGHIFKYMEDLDTNMVQDDDVTYDSVAKSLLARQKYLESLNSEKDPVLETHRLISKFPGK